MFYSARSLYINNNHLASLPTTIKRLRLTTIDLSDNTPLCTNTQPNELPIVEALAAPVRLPPLWELAARCVTAKRLPVRAGWLPATLIDVLAELPACECGQLCYGAMVLRCWMPLTVQAENVIGACGRHVMYDAVYCGRSCLLKRWPGARQRR